MKDHNYVHAHVYQAIAIACLYHFAFSSGQNLFYQLTQYVAKLTFYKKTIFPGSQKVLNQQTNCHAWWGSVVPVENIGVGKLWPNTNWGFLQAAKQHFYQNISAEIMVIISFL